MQGFTISNPEIDGSSHEGIEAQIRDETRQERLESLGGSFFKI
ncbi:MAG: hypothetical protein R2728_04700 [Chitinophagales bacterium]